MAKCNGEVCYLSFQITSVEHKHRLIRLLKSSGMLCRLLLCFRKF